MKWMGWALVCKHNRCGGKTMQRHKHNWGGVHKHKEDGGTRWLYIIPATTLEIMYKIFNSLPDLLKYLGIEFDCC